MRWVLPSAVCCVIRLTAGTSAAGTEDDEEDEDEDVEGAREGDDGVADGRGEGRGEGVGGEGRPVDPAVGLTLPAELRFEFGGRDMGAMGVDTNT